MKYYLPILSFLFLLFVAQPSLSQKLYWSETGGVKSVNTNGTLEQTLNTSQSLGVAIDTVNGKIYYSTSAGDIIRSNLDGTLQETLFFNGNYRDIALNPQAGKMYFVSDSTNQVYRANLDGTSVDTLVTLSNNIPEGIAVDDAGDFLFLTAGGTVQKINLSTLNKVTLQTGLGTLGGIDIDDKGKVYWTDNTNGLIQKADTLVSATITNILTLANVKGVAVDRVNDSLYYTVSTDSLGGRIERVAVDGSGTSDTILVNIHFGEHLAIDSRVIPPYPEKLSPADEATNVILNPTLTINFNKPVQIDSGKFISIVKSSNDSTVQQFDVGTTRIEGGGTSNINIFVDSLEVATKYYVLIDSGAFFDYYNDVWEGFTDSSRWNFITESARIIRSNPSGTSDWGSGSTWVNGVVPTASDSVILEHPVTLSTGNFECYGLRLHDDLGTNGQLTITGGSLTVRGDLELNNGYGADTTISLTVNNTGSLTVNRNLIGNRLTGNNMVINISGNSSVNVGGNFAFNHSFVSDTTQEIIIGGGANIRISRGLVFNYFDSDGVSESIDLITRDSAKIWAGNLIANTNWYNKINGRFINQSVLYLSGGIQRIDNFGNPYNAGDIRFGDSTNLILNGSNQMQELAGLYEKSQDSIIYNDIIVNNTFDRNPSVRVEPGTRAIVNGTLDLQNGIVSAGETIMDGILHLTENAKVKGGSDKSHVDSVLYKSGNSDFVFPVGGNGKYAPVGMENLSKNSLYYAIYISNVPRDSASVIPPDPFHNFSFNEVWGIRDSSETATANIRLFWMNGDSAGISDPNDLRVAGVMPDQKKVNDYGQQVVNGNVGSGNILSGSLFQYNSDSVEWLTFGSNSPYENYLGGEPSIPTSYKADSISLTSFTAVWNNTSGADTFLVNVSTDTFTTFVTGYEEVSVTDTSLLVSGLQSDTEYQYRVRAVNENGVSLNSDTIIVKTLPDTATKPDIPVVYEALNVTRTSFTVNWDSAAFATEYRVDVSKDTFQTYVNGYKGLVVKDTTQVKIDGLDIGTSYQYRVRAANGLGTSGNSDTVSTSTRANITGTVNGAGLPLTGGKLILLKVTNQGSYDTTATQNFGADGRYQFTPKAGKYLILAEDNDTTFIPTYYPSAITWGNATVIDLESDTTGVDITLESLAEEPSSGSGEIWGIVEQEIAENTTRVLRRRRVAGATVHLRRSTARNRGLAEASEWVLVATTKTDENGDFTFKNLPDALYRLSIEFPGIEMDTTQNVELEINSSKAGKKNARITATVTDEGIVVKEDLSTGIPDNKNKWVQVTPVPAQNWLYIKKLKYRGDLRVDIFNLSGAHQLRSQQKRGVITDKLNVAHLSHGTYIIKIRSEEKNEIIYQGKIIIY